MDKGAYIFYKNPNNIGIFIFIKCTNEEIINVISSYFINIEILPEHNTLTAIFNKKIEYLGSESLEKIPEIIEKLNAADLLNNSLNDLHNKGFISLTENDYNNMINFSKKQLNC